MKFWETQESRPGRLAPKLPAKASAALTVTVPELFQPVRLPDSNPPLTKLADATPAKTNTDKAIIASFMADLLGDLERM